MCGQMTMVITSPCSRHGRCDYQLLTPMEARPPARRSSNTAGSPSRRLDPPSRLSLFAFTRCTLERIMKRLLRRLGVDLARWPSSHRRTRLAYLVSDGDGFWDSCAVRRSPPDFAGLCPAVEWGELALATCNNRLRRTTAGVAVVEPHAGSVVGILPPVSAAFTAPPPLAPFLPRFSAGCQSELICGCGCESMHPAAA